VSKSCIKICLIIEFISSTKDKIFNILIYTSGANPSPLGDDFSLKLLSLRKNAIFSSFTIFLISSFDKKMPLVIESTVLTPSKE
jgi:hypothetical protein